MKGESASKAARIGSPIERARAFIDRHLCRVLVEVGSVGVFGPDICLDEGAVLGSADDLDPEKHPSLLSLGKTSALLSFAPGSETASSALRLLEIRPRWHCAVWCPENKPPRIVAAVPRESGQEGLDALLRYLFSTNGEYVGLDLVAAGEPILKGSRKVTRDQLALMIDLLGRWFDRTYPETLPAVRTYRRIDYSFRPATYWNDKEFTARLQVIEDEERRAAILLRWRTGRLDPSDIAILEAAWPRKSVRQRKVVHPCLHDDAFLPIGGLGEVEVARIELQSVTGDVVSVRARRDPAGIRYRIVDEYEGEYILARETSAEPLTLREMVEFLDRSRLEGLPNGLSIGYNCMNTSSGLEREAARYFTRISSDFYPKLEAHYEARFDEWVAEDDVR